MKICRNDVPDGEEWSPHLYASHGGFYAVGLEPSIEKALFISADLPAVAVLIQGGYACWMSKPGAGPPFAVPPRSISITD